MRVVEWFHLNDDLMALSPNGASGLLKTWVVLSRCHPEGKPMRIVDDKTGLP